MTEFSRRQVLAYAVVVVLVVLLGGRALRAGAAAEGTGDPAVGFGTGAPADAGRGGATGTSGVAVAEAAPERVLVHVAGAVRRPGVYELRGGARIQDAVHEAGGGRAGADLDALNLAAKVTDGQQVLVARRGSRAATAVASASAPGGGAAGTAGGAPAPGAAGAQVDVNAADVTQLEALNGVGPAIAAKIVDWRTQHGPFRTVDDLAQVAGIGPKKLEAMRAQVVT